MVRGLVASVVETRVPAAAAQVDDTERRCLVKADVVAMVSVHDIRGDVNKLVESIL